MITIVNIELMVMVVVVVVQMVVMDGSGGDVGG